MAQATITPRSALSVDTAYYIRKDDMYFITPDGVGGYWFDTIEELEDEYGFQSAEPEEIEELEE
jgi:hypothetical protein